MIEETILNTERDIMYTYASFIYDIPEQKKKNLLTFRNRTYLITQVIFFYHYNFPDQTRFAQRIFISY